LPELSPVTFLQRVRFELRHDKVGFLVRLEHVLDILECAVLSHAIRHLLGRLEQRIKLLTEPPRNDSDSEPRIENQTTV